MSRPDGQLWLSASPQLGDLTAHSVLTTIAARIVAGLVSQPMLATRSADGIAGAHARAARHGPKSDRAG